MLGGALLLIGLAASAWGVRAATSGARPLDLAGALVAPLGIAVAAVGAAALAVAGFLG
jgi:hypothetical protein